MLEIDPQNLESYEEDDPEVHQYESDHLRIIVCMSCEGSKRLLNAQYIQSDIAFRRITGFHEFELAAVDRDAKTSTHKLLFACSY